MMTMFKNKKKSYGNGAQIGRKNSITFFLILPLGAFKKQDQQDQHNSMICCLFSDCDSILTNDNIKHKFNKFETKFELQ